MRVIILAAGRGSRMLDLTAGRPKSLVPLAGRPLLAWQTEALRAAGFGPLTVVGGYLAPQLAPYADELLVNERWARTNMLMSLCAASRRLAQEPCLVAYADIVYRPGHAKALAACPDGLAIAYDTRFEALWRLRLGEAWLSDVETFRQEAGRLREIGGRAVDPAAVQGQYMGLLKFTPQGWARVEAHLRGLPPEAADRLDMTALLSGMLAAGEDIRAVPVDGGWCEVDSEGDLHAYELALAAGGWSHDWREP